MRRTTEAPRKGDPSSDTAALESSKREEDLGGKAARVIFGVGSGLASTVYGTVVAMATLTAAYATERDPWRLAVIVMSAALVLWIAHVYSHSLSRMITHSRPSFAHVRSIAVNELGILLAAVPPCAVLVLGAIGILRETTAAWLALGVGLFVLAAEGVRYARLEGMGLSGTLIAMCLNLSLGLLVVILKVLVAH